MTSEFKVTDMLKQMLTYIDQIDEEETNPTPVNPSQVWPLLYDVCLNQPDVWENIFATLSNYVKEDEEFLKTKDSFLEEKLNSFLKGTFQYQYDNLRPVVYLLPFLPGNFVIPIFTQLVKLFNDSLSSFNETKFFPKELLNVFDRCLADYFEPEIHANVANFFMTSSADASTSVATVCIFTPIITDLLRSASEESLLPQFNKACFSIIKQFVKNEEDLLHKISGLFFLEYVVEFWAIYVHDHQSEGNQLKDSMLLGKDLYTFLLPFLLSDDSMVRKYAFHAAENAALSPFLLKSKDVSKIILKDFGKFNTPEKLVVYFKLLSSLVDTKSDDSDDEDDNSPGLDFLEQFLTFITDLIKNDDADPLAKAYSLDILVTISQSLENNDVIEDLLQPSLKAIGSFIDQNLYHTFPGFVTFLCYISKEFGDGDEADQTLTAFLDKYTSPLIIALKEIIKIPNIKPSHVLNYAKSVAKLVKDGYAQKSFPPLFEFAKNKILSDTKKTNEASNIRDILLFETQYEKSMNVVSIAASIFRSLVNVLSLEQSTTTYDLVSKQLDNLKANDYGTTNDLLKTLARILDNYKIPSSDIIAHQLIDGSFPLFAATKSDLLHFNEFLPAYDFLESYSKQYPEKTGFIIDKLLEWYSNVEDVLDSDGASGTFEILSQIAQLGLIKDEQLAIKVCNSIKPILKNSTLEHIDLAAGIVRTIQPIRESFPTALNPINDFLDPLAFFAKQKVDLENEEEDDEEDEEKEDLADALDIMMPDVSIFALSAYVNNPELEIDFDFIKNLVSMMPFSPNEEDDDQNYMQEIFTLLIQILKQSDRFDQAILDICKLFAEMLMMKKNELEEFLLSEEILKDMKSELKTIFKQKPALEKQVEKIYSKQRTTLNKFKALIR